MVSDFLAFASKSTLKSKKGRKKKSDLSSAGDIDVDDGTKFKQDDVLPIGSQKSLSKRNTRQNSAPSIKSPQTKK